MKLKSIFLTLTLVMGLTLGFAQLIGGKKGGDAEPAVSKAAEYKAKSREKIKPHRYDGSKITYFNYGTFEQIKSVEVLLFNGIDYKFCFNTEGVPKSIDLKIYDRESLKNETDKGKRILLYEANGVMGKDVVVTSEELLKTLQATKSVTSLKKVFIEYHVPIGDKVAPAPAPEGKKSKDAPATNPQEQGIVVVSYGYKNV
ncbi:MAG TPA: hypothetical protein VK177_09040 [Flavobacteriales bacterium]|nr:hypothetical protein [Flavobacteriales bacterium]